MTEKQIQFVMWVTGHDRETILKLWKNFEKFQKILV